MAAGGVKLESIGNGLSVLCAAHCLALPALAGASFFSHDVAGTPWVEVALIGAAAVIGYATLGAGFRRHRRRLPLALLTLGLGAVILGHTPFLHAVGGGAAAAGALLLVAAQWLNRRCSAPCCAGPREDGGRSQLHGVRS